MEVVSKLSDNLFRPFFRRLYDWAFAEDESERSSCFRLFSFVNSTATDNRKRQKVFCDVFSKLLDMFKVWIFRLYQPSG
jgi:hypothetical protein